MIYCDRGPIRLDDMRYASKLTVLHLEILREEESNSAVLFKVPDRFQTNKEKAIYKIGFLNGFLKLLYPEKPYHKIVEIMNDRYQVFLGQRQVERNVKEYLENDIYR